MFVVRRRSDGKFRRNSGGSIWRKMRPSEWVEDLAEVKPYRTIGAIRASIGPGKGTTGYHFSEKVRKGELTNDCCKAVKWNVLRGYINKCRHLKAMEQAEDAKFDRLYEIPPVKLVLVTE